MRIISFARYWLPVILWMGAIFLVSSRSTLPGPLAARSLAGEIFRYGAHFGEYAILAALTYRAVRNSAELEALRLPPRAVQGDSTRRRGLMPQWKKCGLALAVAVGYAIFDEWHQSFVPGRQFALWDVALDAGGSVIALIAIKAFLSPE